MLLPHGSDVLTHFTAWSRALPALTGLGAIALVVTTRANPLATVVYPVKGLHAIGTADRTDHLGLRVA